MKRNEHEATGIIAGVLILGLLIGLGQAARADGGEKRHELTSLLSKSLTSPPPDGDLAKLEADLKKAREALAADPDDPEKTVWVGRRIGYLWRMNEAVDVYTKGIEKHPDYAPFYRHRGHRYISLRKFDLAIADLEKDRWRLCSTEVKAEYGNPEYRREQKILVTDKEANIRNRRLFR